MGFDYKTMYSSNKRIMVIWGPVNIHVGEYFKGKHITEQFQIQEGRMEDTFGGQVLSLRWWNMFKRLQWQTRALLGMSTVTI